MSLAEEGAAGQEGHPPESEPGADFSELDLDTGRPHLEEVGYAGLHRTIRCIPVCGRSSPFPPEVLAQVA